jgi:phosphoribosylanthranilate isomerase
VGVLVNPDENELEKFSQLNLDYFQLYGNYTENSLSRIKERYKKNIITALQVKKKTGC